MTRRHKDGGRLKGDGSHWLTWCDEVGGCPWCSRTPIPENALSQAALKGIVAMVKDSAQHDIFYSYKNTLGEEDGL